MELQENTLRETVLLLLDQLKEERAKVRQLQDVLLDQSQRLKRQTEKLETQSAELETVRQEARRLQGQIGDQTEAQDLIGRALDQLMNLEDKLG
ncbi:MAG: hypothetical protein H6510_12780 [Acidobacteria bacterium]|nr:hypothetical protein [Acidobacteriota bacterium]MCB9398681.1 hypothetical protein [Acidobacteriota bacterium]